MNATVESDAERAALIERLQGALDALESGDQVAWRREVDHLAALRTRPMMQSLSRLARELGQALGELPTVPEEAGELDDACSRLDHVVEMTERPATARWIWSKNAASWPTSCAKAGSTRTRARCWKNAPQPHRAVAGAELPGPQRPDHPSRGRYRATRA